MKNNTDFSMGEFDFGLDDDLFKELQSGQMSPQAIEQINAIPKEDLLAQVRQNIQSRVENTAPDLIKAERQVALDEAKPGMDVRIARAISEFAGGMAGKPSNLATFMAQDKSAREEINKKFDTQKSDYQKDLSILQDFKKMSAQEKLQELQSANLILGMKGDELGLKLKQQAFGDAQGARDPKSQQSIFARQTVKDAFGLEVPETVNAVQLKGYMDQAPAAMQAKAKALMEQIKELKKPTEGQKTLDKEFAKDLNEWESRGRSNYQKNLDRLKAAKDTLVKNKDALLGTSGRFEGRMPDIMRSEQSIALREDVQGAAQGALRATLGPQFTEKEGERIMSVAYNEKLSPEENIKKIDAAIKELESNAASIEGRAKEFLKGGSLKGYESSPVEDAASRFTGQDKAAYEWLQANPNHPRAEEVRKKLGL